MFYHVLVFSHMCGVHMYACIYIYIYTYTYRYTYRYRYRYRYRYKCTCVVVCCRSNMLLPPPIVPAKGRVSYPWPMPGSQASPPLVANLPLKEMEYISEYMQERVEKHTRSISSHLISSHLISSHLISSHLISPSLIIHIYIYALVCINTATP